MMYATLHPKMDPTIPRTTETSSSEHRIAIAGWPEVLNRGRNLSRTDIFIGFIKTKNKKLTKYRC